MELLLHFSIETHLLMSRPTGHVAVAGPYKWIKNLRLLHWKLSAESDIGGRFTALGKRKAWDPFHCTGEMEAD